MLGNIILTMQSPYVWLHETSSSAPPSSRELAVRVLEFLTPALALLLLVLGLASKYPWLLDGLILVAVIVLLWFAKPRLTAWFQRLGQRRKERRFLSATEAKLYELRDQFAEFISNSNSRSFISIIRSSYSQNATAVDQIIGGDYIGTWFEAYRSQLTFATKDAQQFLARCREFSDILQQFNTYYVQRAQRQLALAAPLPEQNIGELESFREEYNAFLRNVKSWANGIAGYLQSCGVTDVPTLWQLAPTAYFEPAKSFIRSKSAGQ